MAEILDQISLAMEKLWNDLAGLVLQDAGALKLGFQPVFDFGRKWKLPTLAIFCFARLQPQPSGIEMQVMFLPRQDLRMSTPKVGEVFTFPVLWLRNVG